MPYFCGVCVSCFPRLGEFEAVVPWRKFFVLLCGFLPNTTSIRDTVCHVTELLNNDKKDGITFDLFSGASS